MGRGCGNRTNSSAAKDFVTIFLAITHMTYTCFYALNECQYQCCLKSIAIIDDSLYLQEKQRTQEDDEKGE